MAMLDWIGKREVLNQHRRIPFHLLRSESSPSGSISPSGNLLLQGDNLLALKALLPYYHGQVKCIYIDPPYNTGNEGWVYNDNVNSPMIKEWLAKTVGKEAEDLSRHDKWLCMMYPRLQLLYEFLRDDGALFVSIDDNESHNLRLLLDEIFGARNFVTTIIWQKVFSPKNSARHFSEDHDYIVVYAKNKDKWHPNLLARSASRTLNYTNPDNDPRGPWDSSDLSARNFYSKGTYSVTCPSGRVIPGPTAGRYWTISREEFEALDRDGRIWWGKNGSSVPRLKRFLSEVKDGVVPQTLWLHEDVGHTQEAKKEVLAMVPFANSGEVFITPKPLRLIERILEIATDKDSIVLDSFAGSGTTGHAVLSMNRKDGGNRRFLLVEMEPTIAEQVTAVRLRNAIEGYQHIKTKKDVPGLSGDFQYCTLHTPLFDEYGQIRPTVAFPELATHVFFTATGRPLCPSGQIGETPFLGEEDGVGYYLLYNGILKDTNPETGNVLTVDVLRTLPPYGGPRIIYADGCLLPSDRLKQEKITFRQIPYEVKVN